MSSTEQPSYQSIIQTLHEKGLQDLAAQLTILAASSNQAQPNPNESNSPTNHHDPNQLENDLNDFTHLPTFSPDNINKLSPPTAHLNIALDVRTPFTSYLAAATLCGKYISIFDGINIVVLYSDELFSSHVMNSQKSQQSMNQVFPRTLCKWSLPNQQFIIRMMKWSPAENTLFVLCTNNTILLYTLGHPIPLHIRDNDDISSFDIHPTGKFLLLASRETPLIKLYDLTTFTLSVPFHTNALCTQQHTHDGQKQLTTIQYINETNLGQATTTQNTNDNNNNNMSVSNDNNNNNTTHTSLHNQSQHLIQSTQLPQFPVYDIKYSNFATYFAVLTVSPQIVNNLPIVQINIYNTTDHTLFTSFNLPNNNHIVEFSTMLQHLSPINSVIQANSTSTTPSATSSSSQNTNRPFPQLPHSLDSSICPISLQWSHNDRYLLVTTPFQPFLSAQGDSAHTIAHLFNIQDGKLILTYSPSSSSSHKTDLPSSLSSSSSSLASLPQSPIITAQSVISNPSLLNFYTGYKAFFSLDSQHIFIISPPSLSTPQANVADLQRTLAIFHTSTGNQISNFEIDFYSTDNNNNNMNNNNNNNTSIAITNNNDNNPINDNNNNANNNNSNKDFTKQQQKAPVGIPTVIIPHPSRPAFYFFSANSFAFEIDYSIASNYSVFQ